MISLVYGHSEAINKWVSHRLFGVYSRFDGGVSIGIAKNNSLIAGIVYDTMTTRPDGTPYGIDMNIATIDKRWANRHTLRAIFAYPFIQLKLERVQIITSAANDGVNSLVNRLGYKKEGTHRKAWPCGGDAYSWGMLREECKWIK